jgi:HK97 family phage prohead protease
MDHKTFELLETKAIDDETGTFSALASVFNNVDRVGDKMLPGSFTKTLDAWRKKGKPLPVILSHNWDDPHAYVGEADPRAVFEDGRGLVVQGQMYMNEDLGRKVYELMKKGILTGWSFGYQVTDQVKNGKVNEIKEVELFEVGPTLVGANPEAQLQEIKSVLQAENGDESSTSQEEKEAIEETDGTHEEPERAKSRPDALREESRKTALKVLSGGASLKKPTSPPADPEPDMGELVELRRESRKAVLKVLSGGQIDDAT